jgi:hypothetical protein
VFRCKPVPVKPLVFATARWTLSAVQLKHAPVCVRLLWRSDARMPLHIGAHPALPR